MDYQKENVSHLIQSIDPSILSISLCPSAPSQFLSQSVRQGVEEVRRPAMDYRAALIPLDSSLAWGDYVCVSPREGNLSETIICGVSWSPALISWPIRLKGKPQHTLILLCTDPFPPLSIAHIKTLSLSLFHCKASTLHSDDMIFACNSDR